MDARCALCGEQIKELYTFPDGVVCICDECKAAVAWARKQKENEDKVVKWFAESKAHEDCSYITKNGLCITTTTTANLIGGDGVAGMGEVE